MASTCWLSHAFSSSSSAIASWALMRLLAQQAYWQNPTSRMSSPRGSLHSRFGASGRPGSVQAPMASSVHSLVVLGSLSTPTSSLWRKSSVSASHGRQPARLASRSPFSIIIFLGAVARSSKT